MNPSRFALTLLVILCIPSSLFSQDLATRYKHLSCAVVQVRFDGGAGTAFFINNSGRLVTVAHVLYDRKIS